MTHKTCSKCRKHKPIDEFDRHKSRADGYDGQCKTCKRAAQATRRRNKTRKAVVHRQQLFPADYGVRPKRKAANSGDWDRSEYKSQQWLEQETARKATVEALLRPPPLYASDGITRLDQPRGG